MTELHPSEEDLLLHAEGDLPSAQAARVRGHVEGCSECAQAVAELERARGVLRAAPLLELPRERREALLASLPEHERPQRRRRVLALLAPAAAAAAIVAAAVTVLDDPERPSPEVAAQSEERAAERESAEAGADAAGDEEAAGAPEALQGQAALRSVAGPPGDVAELLRDRGLDARVVGGRVEVRGASAPTVRNALAGRADGDVDVVVR